MPKQEGDKGSLLLLFLLLLLLFLLFLLFLLLFLLLLLFFFFFFSSSSSSFKSAMLFCKPHRLSPSPLFRSLQTPRHSSPSGAVCAVGDAEGGVAILSSDLKVRWCIHCPPCVVACVLLTCTERGDGGCVGLYVRESERDTHSLLHSLLHTLTPSLLHTHTHAAVGAAANKAPCPLCHVTVIHRGTQHQHQQQRTRACLEHIW